MRLVLLSFLWTAFAQTICPPGSYWAGTLSDGTPDCRPCEPGLRNCVSEEPTFTPTATPTLCEEYMCIPPKILVHNKWCFWNVTENAQPICEQNDMFNNVLQLCVNGYPTTSADELCKDGYIVGNYNNTVYCIRKYDPLYECPPGFKLYYTDKLPKCYLVDEALCANSTKYTTPYPTPFAIYESHSSSVTPSSSMTPRESASQTQTPKEVPRESASQTQTPKEVPRESASQTQTPKEVPRESASQTQTPKEVPRESASNTPKEVPRESASNTPKEVPRESASPSMTPREVQKESASPSMTPREIQKESASQTPKLRSSYTATLTPKVRPSIKPCDDPKNPICIKPDSLLSLYSNLRMSPLPSARPSAIPVASIINEPFPSPWIISDKFVVELSNIPVYIPSRLNLVAEDISNFEKPETVQQLQSSLACSLRMPLDRIRIEAIYKVSLVSGEKTKLLIDPISWMIGNNNSDNCIRFENATANTKSIARRMQKSESESQIQIDYLILEPTREVLALNSTEFAKVIASSSTMISFAMSVGSSTIESSMATSQESSSQEPQPPQIAGSIFDNKLTFGAILGGGIVGIGVLMYIVHVSLKSKRRNVNARLSRNSDYNISNPILITQNPTRSMV
jgi:hypothetical protein